MGSGSTRGDESDSSRAMSKTFRPWDVEQRWLLPPSVHELVPAGHVAHFVRDTVREELDLSAIFAAYDEERGYPPYHPTMMVALLLYAYSRGLYSSRRIAQACEERVDFMAVTAMNQPDFRTIAKFRRRHLKALSDLFVQVLKLCQAAGLVKLGHVALDGSKIAANASVHKAMSYGRMGETEKRLAAEVSAWLSQAETTDAAEDRAHGSDQRGDEMPDWVANKAARLERIRAAKAFLEAEAKQPPPDDEDGPGPSSGMMKSGKPQRGPDGGPPDRAQRNFTDPDSRIQPLRSKAVIAGYNAQIAVDGAHQVIVAQRLQTSPADARALPGLLADVARCWAPIPRRSLQTLATATNKTSSISLAVASTATSLLDEPAMVRSMRPVRDDGRRDRARPPWRRSSSAPAGAVATGCANRLSNRCSDRSSKPGGSGSSCCVGSTSQRRMGDALYRPQPAQAGQSHRVTS
jgi:transposase